MQLTTAEKDGKVWTWFLITFSSEELMANWLGSEYFTTIVIICNYRAKPITNIYY